LSARHGAPRSRPPRARTQPRVPGAVARLRWLIVCGVVLAMAGAGLAIGVYHQSRVTSRDTAADTAASGSPAPRLSVSAQATLGRAVQTPASAAPAVRSPGRTSASAAASPHASASASPSASASSSRRAALTPLATAEYQTPRGANELAWSEAILTRIGAPLTDANIVSIGYWMQNEAGYPPYGIVGANNPINVSQPGYGGTPIKQEGCCYSLYSYPTVQDGVDAIAAYLARPSYTAILAALKAGSGLSSPSLASEFSVYSGGGYTTVPDSYGASQGKPET
jgi:hypothetical protein